MKLDEGKEVIQDERLQRPENFLGLQELSSGDNENRFKYACTDELEEALSSVHAGQVNMGISIDEFEDLRCYLKEKTAGDKLLQLRSMRHAVQKVQQKIKIDDQQSPDDQEDLSSLRPSIMHSHLAQSPIRDERKESSM